jgi:hypothetical protein
METIRCVTLASEQIAHQHVCEREASFLRSYDNRSPEFPEFDPEEDDGDIAFGR